MSPSQQCWAVAELQPGLPRGSRHARGHMQKRLHSPTYLEDQLSFEVLSGTLSVVVNHGPVLTDPNIPKWISLPIMGCGRDLEVSSPDHTTLQRRKLRQIPERFIRGHRLQQRTQDPHTKAWLPSSAPSPGQPLLEGPSEGVERTPLAPTRTLYADRT